MDWIEVFVKTTSFGIEPVSGLLYNEGLTGLMIEDTQDFDEFLKNPDRDWDYVEDELVGMKKGKTGITFFVRRNVYGINTLENIEKSLKVLKKVQTDFDIGSLEIVIKNIKEEDWANNWKKYFKPFEVGEKILIKPSWEEFGEQTDRIILNIDPGHIFGTGAHETTRLCLEAIEKYVSGGETIFDLGCGSGILSIAGLLLGASSIDAIDIDKNAVMVVNDNLKMNGLSQDRLNVYAGNILEDRELLSKFAVNRYDIVFANIVADVIIPSAEIVPKLLKEKGIFISSGIIEGRLEEVYSALEKNKFEVIETDQKKDWFCVISRYTGGIER